ncbi:hypothetical protein CDCA_CDCA20G4805 [Cyanidium caldarium]|uniref:Transcription factor BYE1 n=1 Tax=Cyanidium caldarium TaxID=2771 RepID=A0AAV9J326_CYACA|nr:hypothetical protein CDCA_CDCA20G4805 [Cyanidium caldarium]
MSDSEPNLSAEASAPSESPGPADASSTDAGASDTEYCVCRRRHVEGEFMVQCDLCEDWFHPRCVGMPRAEIEQLDVFVCGDCQAEHSGEQSAAAKRAIVEQFQREHRQWQERQRQARQQRRTAPGEDQAEGGHSRGTNGSEPSVADAPSPHNEAPSPSRKRPRRERPAQAPLSVAVAPSAAAIAEARTKARQLLAQVLHAQLAESIEHALYLCLGERVNDEYRQRLRNLVSNLRDGRNPELRQAVLRGDIAPEALCRMNSDELASEQMRARREQQLSRAERLRVIESAEQVGLVFKAQAHVQEPSLMAEAVTATDKLWASPPTAADETTASVKKDEEEERPATPPPSKMAPPPREPPSDDETSSAGAASPTRSELGQKTSPRRTEAAPLRFPQPPPPTFTAAPAHQFDESAFHEASQQLSPPPSPADISASSASSSSTPSSVAAGRDLAADHKARPGAAPPSPATTDDAATTAPLWHGTLRMPALGTCRVAVRLPPGMAWSATERSHCRACLGSSPGRLKEVARIRLADAVSFIRGVQQRSQSRTALVLQIVPPPAEEKNAVAVDAEAQRLAAARDELVRSDRASLLARTDTHEAYLLPNASSGQQLQQPAAASPTEVPLLLALVVRRELPPTETAANSHAALAAARPGAAVPAFDVGATLQLLQQMRHQHSDPMAAWSAPSPPPPYHPFPHDRR